MTKHQADRPTWIMDCLRIKPSATIRELADVVGLASTSAVHHHLGNLERQGKIQRSVCDECGHDRWRVVA